MDTATSGRPDLHGPGLSMSRAHQRETKSVDGRPISHLVEAMPTDAQGRCKLWHIKAQRWVWRWSVDAVEGVLCGQLSYKETKIATKPKPPAPVSADNITVDSLEGLDVAGLQLHAKMIEFEIDGRWKEHRLRNELHAEIKRRAAPAQE